jgi:cysteine desulfurase/selenocysteine lyase
LLAQEKDADLEFVPFDSEGHLNMDSWEVLLRTKPKLVAFTHKSNALGTVTAVKEMVAQAHAVGALVLVDGAQAVPHLPVDVQDIGADFYVFSGHKALAPAGSGALWARRELLESMPPFLSGGDMIESVHLRHTTFNEIPYKFEAGTPDVAAAIGLGAAIDYLSALGMDRVAAHEEVLTEYALEVLPREVPEITIHGPRAAAERSGIVTFTLPEAHAHDVASLLDREAIAIRAGHHCAQPLHERLGVAATGRASFNVYSGTDDIDRLAAGLQHVQRIFSRGATPAPGRSTESSTREALPTAPVSTGGAS